MRKGVSCGHKNKDTPLNQGLRLLLQEQIFLCICTLLLKMAKKIRYEPGQHFVLDQIAARTIKRYKIKTVILKDVDNLEKCLRGKKFVGTVIS